MSVKNIVLLILTSISFQSFAYDICTDVSFILAGDSARQHKRLMAKWRAHQSSGMGYVKPLRPLDYRAGVRYLRECKGFFQSQPKFLDENVWEVKQAQGAGDSGVRIYTEIFNQAGQSLILSCDPEKETEIRAVVFFEGSGNGGLADDYDVISANSDQMLISSEVDGKTVELFEQSRWSLLEGDARGITASMFRHTEEGQETLEMLAGGYKADLTITLEGIVSFKKQMKFSLQGSRKALEKWGSECKRGDVGSTLIELP